MPRLLMGTSKTKTNSNGEISVNITLELIIKMDSDGVVVSANAVPSSKEVESQSKGDVDSEKNHVLPHFDNSEKIDNII